MWGAHYGPLAGWLAAITGDRCVAWTIADETFVRMFSRWSVPRCPRRLLYVDALERLERRHGAATWGPAPGGWLGELVRGLPAISRRAVLLHHAGLTDREIAGALHLGSAAGVGALLDLSGRLEPTVRDVGAPESCSGVEVSPQPADERVGSVS